MSVKSIVEGIEMARTNNRNLGVSVEAKLNDMIAQIEDVKRAFAAEIDERDRDLERLLTGNPGSDSTYPAIMTEAAARIEALEAENARLREALEGKPRDEAEAFDRADWFWRVYDPDDCGDTPSEALNRAMVGRFCVCEVASSYLGPVRYGFIAPVTDPESDDEEFVHFATCEEAVEAAKARAALEEK